jgi:FtsZ-binding cell division protein ZapB
MSKYSNLHTYEVNADLAALRAENERLKAENSKLTDHVDLMVDEFKRIRVIVDNSPGCFNSYLKLEVEGLCDRAISTTYQHVPVITQRDNAEQEVETLKADKRELVEAMESVLKRERQLGIFHATEEILQAAVAKHGDCTP